MKTPATFWCIVEDITVPDMESRRGPKKDWGTTEGKERRIKNLTDNSGETFGAMEHHGGRMPGKRYQSMGERRPGQRRQTNRTASKGQIALQAEGSGGGIPESGADADNKAYRRKINPDACVFDLGWALKQGFLTEC